MAEDDVLDAQQAARLLKRSADHARKQLMPNQSVIYGVWGLAWLPLLLVGLIYMLAAGMWQDRIMFWLGLWALLVAAAGAWTGPVGVLFMDAVAGGGGFLAASVLLAWRNRS